TGVDADLGVGVALDPDQLQIRVVDHESHGVQPDRPGAPLDDLHVPCSSRTCWGIECVSSTHVITSNQAVNEARSSQNVKIPFQANGPLWKNTIIPAGQKLAATNRLK